MSAALRTGQLHVGAWLVDPALDRLSRGGEIVKLEPRTMRLLLRLCESPGQVMSPQQLLDDVWSGVVVGPASLYQAISQLRKLLVDSDPSPTYIATVPRKGYRLIAPVRRVAAADPQIGPAPGAIEVEAIDSGTIEPGTIEPGSIQSGSIEPGQKITRTAQRGRWPWRVLWAMGLVLAIASASIVLLRDGSLSQTWLSQGWLAMTWFSW